MLLFTEYAQIARDQPGWGLSEIKDMAIREREWWLALKKWKDEQRQWQEMNQKPPMVN